MTQQNQPEVITSERHQSDLGIEIPVAGENQETQAMSRPRTVVMPPVDERGARSQVSERVIVRHSDEIGKLVEALAKATLNFGDVDRTLKAKIESRRTGGIYEFVYETLADVIEATRKPLAEQGLVVMQFPFPGTQTLTLRTMLVHSSGQFIYNDITCALEGGLDPKSVGSGITYLSRYARKSILGLAADYEDDDGKAASQRKQDPPKPAERRSAKAQATEQRPSPAPTESPIGKVAEIIDRTGGVFLVKLSTGFQCATRDAKMVEALRLHQQAGAVLEVSATPSRDPAKFASVIEEIRLAETT